MNLEATVEMINESVRTNLGEKKKKISYSAWRKIQACVDQ